jgi:transposase
LENANQKLSSFTFTPIIERPQDLGPRKTTARMIDQDTWVSIRLLYLRQGKSKSWLAREFGIARNTVAKYLKKDSEAPKYNASQARGRPISDKWEEHVRAILEEDRNAPRKQKHTAKRVYERLVAEYQFDGSHRTVRMIVSNLKNKPGQAVFLPLQFEPGKDAQVDFGESYADIAGVRTKLQIFEMRLNYSRKKFVMAVRAPNMESFMEAHVRAFEFLGGVPERLTYDNLGLAVVRVGSGKSRTLTKKFKELKGFYAFETNFCTVGIQGAHEKGGVEGGIGFSRRNWLVPLPLPGRAFDPGTARTSVIADTYQTVAYDSNRYSVPAKFVGKPLRLRAYMDKLVLAAGAEVIAEHERIHEKGCYGLKPEHYFDQLERKPHAVPFARPLLQATWPAGYWDFYKKLVERKGAGEGGRDFVRVLRCHMQHGAILTAQAIRDCDSAGLVSADAILQVVAQARFSSCLQPEPLDMTARPALSEYVVELQETIQYQILIGGQNNEHRVA